MTYNKKSQYSERDKKEINRNYKNAQHWNLDAECLEPLKEFCKTLYNNALY